MEHIKPVAGQIVYAIKKNAPDNRYAWYLFIERVHDNGVGHTPTYDVWDLKRNMKHSRSYLDNSDFLYRIYK